MFTQGPLYEAIPIQTTVFDQAIDSLDARMKRLNKRAASLKQTNTRRQTAIKVGFYCLIPITCFCTSLTSIACCALFVRSSTESEPERRIFPPRHRCALVLQVCTPSEFSDPQSDHNHLLPPEIQEMKEITKEIKKTEIEQAKRLALEIFDKIPPLPVRQLIISYLN